MKRHVGSRVRAGVAAAAIAGLMLAGPAALAGETPSTAGAGVDVSGFTSWFASDETSAPAASTAQGTFAPVGTEVEQDASGTWSVVDNDQVSFKVTAIETDPAAGYRMDVALENRTSDTRLMYAIDDVAVNGWENDPFWAIDVAAGKSANTDVRWYGGTGLDGLDETEMTAISFKLRVYDTDDFMADPLVEGYFTVYPQGKDAAAAYVRPAEPSDQVIFQNDQVSASVVAIEDDGAGDLAVCLVLRNDTDTAAMFSMEGVSVNGWMCDPYWAAEVAPHACAYEVVEWMPDDLEDLGIGEVTDISFEMQAYDSETFSPDYYADEQVQLAPQGADKAATDHPREAQPTDKVLADTGEVGVTVVGFGEDEGLFSTYNMQLYLENRTDGPVVFSIDDAYVNDTMCDPFWAAEVAAGKKALVQVRWDESSLERAGVTDYGQISDIQFELEAYDSETYDDLFEETFELQPAEFTQVR